MSVIDLDFPSEGWVDASEKQLFQVEDVHQSMCANIPSDYDKHGMTWTSKTVGEAPVLLLVATGGDQYALNSFRVDASRRATYPSIELFMKIVDIVSPFNAFYFFEESERILREIVRASGTRRYFINSLRCINYFDRDTSNNLGIHRLKDISRIKYAEASNGVLIQCVSNITQCKAAIGVDSQVIAMRHLGMIS